MQEPTNIPEYSVSEISGAVKRTLEGAFGRVRVAGEITELKRYPSGHIYFSLKDESSKIAGIVWKSSVSRLGLAPENGMAVVATGKVTAYGERSSYQLIVERMEFAGAGALLQRIEALRQKLLGEGLFDAAKKRRLPRLPHVIGVITSPQGAVIQDIRTTIERRFPRHLLLWPVPVQGEGAAAKIAAAIRGFNALPADFPRPDVLIVARGGGSLEDLMAFNDEEVVRAAALSRIPLISAVGHETDTTLIDFASDQRAPTPTAAAELAVPARSELVADLAQKAARLAGALARLAQERRLRLNQSAARLPDLPSLLGQARMRLDDRAARLDLALPNLLRARSTSFARLADRLQPALRANVGTKHTKAASVLGRLSVVPLQAMLRERRARLEGAGRQLEAVSPLAVLARGYVLVQDEQGHPVTSAARLSAGQRLGLRFGDGAREVEVK